MITLFLAATLMAPAAANDYRLEQNWLCRPGRRDACTVDQAVTQIEPERGTAIEDHKPAAAPAVDCFYAYPTVSLDVTANADMVANDEERGMVAAQFARFSSVCRTFAPLYRQVTLTALRAGLSGQKIPADPELAYADIASAWRDYMAHDNDGRPFVLIGHSQGSNFLKRLVAEEIDGKPAQSLMLSAMLGGTSVLVPKGTQVGGDFKSVSLCRTSTQTGCAIVWASYRDTNPPPANAIFGVSNREGYEAACTNPAKLEGGTAPLDAVFGFPWWHGGVAQYAKPERSWRVNGTPLSTRFARAPGRLSGICVKGRYANYLSVHVNTAPRTAFDNELTGEAAIGDNAYPDWGFHVVDIAIVQGDLIRLIGTQLAGWKARR